MIWLGTEGLGLCRVSSEVVKVYSTQEGLPMHNVYTVYEDREGVIWVGTWGGLARYNHGSFSSFTKKDGLSSGLISALLEDRDGVLWVGTEDNGLNRFKDGRFTIFDESKGLASNAVFALYQDRSGKLWVGTAKGLQVLNDGTMTTYATAQGLPHPRVHAILESHDGSLWLGTFGGLSHFKDGKFISYTERDGLASDHVRCLYEDKENVLWIGTYDGGLSRLENGKLTRYTTKDGLFSNGVFQILDDGRGNFWMSCNRGIYRVAKRDLNEFAAGRLRSVTSVSFGKSDGLRNSECNGGRQPAGCRARDGRFWFPTQGGVAVLNPNSVTTSAQPPPVVIEEVLSERDPVASREPVEILPGRSAFEINYTGLGMIKPEAISFRYQLAGLDRNWIDAGTRRTAVLSHVPPGDYTFRVIAANSDGIWNEQGASLTIRVVPPFWRRPWFLALMTLGAVAFAATLYRRRDIPSPACTPCPGTLLAPIDPIPGGRTQARRRRAARQPWPEPSDHKESCASGIECSGLQRACQGAV